MPEMSLAATVTAAATATPTLTFKQTALLVAAIVTGMLLAGAVVIWARGEATGVVSATGSKSAGSRGSASVVRSWIAISLVMGILVFCATTFLIPDPTLRSTLFGGLITDAGAAVAYYFSSKAADQAREDILSATTAFSPSASAPTAFTSVSPQNATANAPYVYQFRANGSPSPRYTQSGGPLPAGLSLGADGLLSGTAPGDPGDHPFEVTASNALGEVTETVTLTVAAA